MKKHLKKVMTLVLICATLVMSALPASAASGGWHNWGCCKTETVQFSCGSNATYRVLTQQKGTIALYNTFKRKVTTTGQSYGTYRVTIVKIKDARGRKVNQVICKNKFWTSGSLNAKLAKGTYKMTVKCVGYVPSAKETFGPYSGRYWKAYPRWKVG